MPSKRPPRISDTQPVDETAEVVMTLAEALVSLWGRAEDGADPRVPPSQLRVLTVLDRSGPMNLSSLARQLGAIPSSASRLCDRLVMTGLVERQVSPDSRREVILSLSRQGRRRLAGFAATRRADLAAVLELMPVSARIALRTGLEEFGDAVARGAYEERAEA